MFSILEPIKRAVVKEDLGISEGFLSSGNITLDGSVPERVVGDH